MSLGFHRGDKAAYLAEAQRVAGVDELRTSVPPRTDAAAREDAGAPTPAPILSNADIARSQGYTGDQCSNCNGTHMKWAGHCMVCDDCGTTTGCS